jgi:hypothetical protein
MHLHPHANGDRVTILGARLEAPLLERLTAWSVQLSIETAGDFDLCRQPGLRDDAFEDDGASNPSPSWRWAGTAA